MNKTSVFAWLFLAMAMVMFSSCAKMPQVEIDNAKAAIAEAEALSAAIYVPNAFNAVKDSMKAAMEEVEIQNSKMFKNYKSSIAKFETVVVMSDGVKEKTTLRIAELKTQMQSTLDEVVVLNTENKELVLKAPKGKGGAIILNTINSEILNIDNAVEANASFENSENLNLNLVKVQALKEQAVGLNNELKTVIEKSQSKNK